MKIDLHNHTIFSPDSLNRLEDFEKAYRKRKFDVLAVTDHNRLDAAKIMQARATFPVILGEEVSTQDGDVIGLFINQPIQAGQTAKQTAQQIRAQGGLVYIPHPFDWFGVGLRDKSLQELIRHRLIDFVELYNGKYASLLLNWNNNHVYQFIKNNQLVAAAGSDSHTSRDLGQAYVEVADRYNPWELVANPSLFAQAIKHGRPTSHSSFSLIQGVTIIYAHLARKFIRHPSL